MVVVLGSTLTCQIIYIVLKFETREISYQPGLFMEPLLGSGRTPFHVKPQLRTPFSLLAVTLNPKLYPKPYKPYKP